MSDWWQFRALIKKNIQTLKRTKFSTFLEIFFPAILMLVCYLVKLVFHSTETKWKDEINLDEYLIDKGNFGLDYKIYKDLMENPSNFTSNPEITDLGLGDHIWKYEDKSDRTYNINVTTLAGLPLKYLTMHCYERRAIAFIGFAENDDLGKEIKNYISVEEKKLGRKYSYIEYDSINKLNDYIKGDDFGKNGNPLICFGINFEVVDSTNKKYKASLHYFNDRINNGFEDIPNNLEPYNDEMQKGPNMNDVQKYSDHGYIQIMNIISNYILKKNNNDTSYINFGFALQKYDSYKYNDFSDFTGLYFTFFVALAYICPLILFVLKMIVEKESRTKEVMKIMGMNELTYFLSYFVEYFIINIIYCFLVAVFSYLTFNRIPYFTMVLYLWLYGLDIFALAFFCQSFMDTTRLALVVTSLVYCLMLFFSAAVYDENIKTVYKTLASVFPPVNLLLGAFIFGKFGGKDYDFHQEDINKTYLNYKMSTCFIMFAADFFIYLFIGYYLQNVIPHEYGMAKPFYFLFTPSFWFGEKKKEEENKIEINTDVKELNEEIKVKNDEDLISNNSIFDDNPHKEDDNFQNENLYRDRNKNEDVFMLREVTKVYSDGKMACNNISFNLFRNEIFVLLGRNGAGKTSLINILIGMFEATSGKALYKGDNILLESKMKSFRNKLGICPQHDILFPKLTVREHLEMFCYFKGFDVNQIKNEVDSTLQDFRIHDIENVLAETLSAGQRRKLSIAISIIGGSEVIFLDEPSSGMDITSRRNLWEILKKIIDKKIIILTTHYMEEASVLGNRIGIMAEGVLKCIGTPLFLIEKYGKYLSINIYKEKGADNDKIINFFKSKSDGIEAEILTEEILIRIPKDKPGTKEKNLDIQSFFSDLDNNVGKLKIRNYSASMPTLEDVFLNIGSVRLEEEELLNSGKIDEEKNERILFKQKYIKNFTRKEKFVLDAVTLLKKRLFQIKRDMKTLILEILCPILLVFVGIIVVQINIFEDSDPIYCNNDSLDAFGKQVIYIGEKTTENDDFKTVFNFVSKNVYTEYMGADNSDSSKEGLKKFIENLYIKEKEGIDSFGALYKIKFDKTNHQYSFVEVANGRARQSPMMYAYLFLHKILEIEGIEFEYTHYPLPTTKDNEEKSKGLNNYFLVFFVSVAFSLIPANFISSIVTERINNSKHLMRISGVNIIAYWLINFLFELVKYYITGGICVFILWIFDYVPRYLYILYLLYGLPMITFTYLLSFFFSTESSAQNFMILFNLIIGSLGSVVVIMLRAIEKSTDAAKVVAYFLRIIPSFAFGYGYNLLLNGNLILYIDYSLEALNKSESIYITLEYSGSDALYLGVTFVIYGLFIFFIEYNRYTVDKVDDSLLETGEISDKNVKKEIKKANKIEVNEDSIDDNDILEKNKMELENGMKADKENLLVLNNPNQGSVSLSIENLQKKSRNVKGKSDSNQKDNFQIESILSENSSENVKEQEGNYKDINKNDYSVRIKNMQKIYDINSCIKKPTLGVKNISFTVNYGECFGLLGLNGAGKTTIFKAITEEHNPTHGSIYINGLNINKNFDKVKLMFGYCPQFDAIFYYMTVKENLEFYSRIKGVAPEKISEIVQAMIESMTLTKYTNKLAGRLSGGNKRKLSVAISMICNPPIVLLDEPSTGMDPEARRFMWAVIHKLTSKSQSNSVIMTTHSMDEAETLCKRMGIMVNGEFVCIGTSNYIKETYGYGYEIDMRIKPYEQKELERIIENLGLKRNHKIKSLEEVKGILIKINKQNFCKYLKEEGIGRKIYNEVVHHGNIHIQTLVNWARYVSYAMKMINVVLPHFNEIILSEFIENNFLFAIKKSKNSKSIGFLFTILEKEKENFEITEYSIQQTSLEQIFNKFAENQGKTEEDIKNEKKVDTNIKIDANFVNDLIQ